MHSPVTDRDRLLDLAAKILDRMDSGHFARALRESAPIEAPQAGGVQGEIVTRSLGDALDWARLESRERESKRRGEKSRRPYIPSNQALALLQSAMEEGIEREAAPAGATPVTEAPMDPADPGWVTVAWERFSSLFRGKHDFISHSNLTDFQEPLPDNAVVALYSDWGTGTDTAMRVMRQIRAAAPTHAIHLGDVYYSGTKREITRRFLEPIKDHGPGAGCVHRALNSNHEMYSGGHGYFGTTLPKFGQQASYFNLRTSKFQLIGIDTGYEDHGLHDPQRPWLEEQLSNHGGRKSILLSHHQLFSPWESRAYGRALHRKITPLLGGVHAWFWGHEHRCIVFGDHMGIKARCIGHGAMPEDVPYPAPEFGNVPVVQVDQRVAPGTRDDNIHGFALLRFNGPSLQVSYIDEFGNLFFQENL